MPRLEKGSQEAKDYMRMIREKKTTTSTTNYETSKGKKSQKNIVINFDKEVETLPSGEKIVKTTKRTKKQPETQPEPQQDPVVDFEELTTENVVLPTKTPRQKYATDEERRQAKREQTLASNKRKREERKQARLALQAYEQIQGEGVVKDIIEGVKKAGRKTKRAFEKGAEVVSDTAQKVIKDVSSSVKNVAKATKDYGTAVVKGRNDYPPKVREILNKYGNEEVIGLTIMRTPVPSVLTGALSLFSGGEFGKRMKNAFDTLFHLFLEIQTKSGKRLSVEKNEVINMDVSPKKRPETETKVVSNIPEGLTINEMMNKTKDYQGGKFFKYSAANNNCQDFIVAIFRSNSIGDDSDIKFIKQDTEQLFKDLPSLRKLSNTITDIGGAFNVAVTGKGVEKDYIVQSVIFDKDKHSITESKKWLRTNGYVAPKVDRSDGFYRFRQIEPSVVDNEGFTEYRTKELGDGSIKLILAYKKKISPKSIMPRKPMKGGAICEMCKCEIEDEEEMTGGKINIGKAFKKLGSDIKKGVQKEIINPIKSGVQKEIVQPIKSGIDKEIVKPTKQIVDKSKKGVMEGFINPADKYVTSKKGGLSSDLVRFGIPALSGAVLGGLATAATGGNPVAGVAGSALGSKLGSLAAKEVQKATGTGMRRGRFEKGSPEARAHMAMIRNMKNK
jgi:hypothetical protein